MWYKLANNPEDASMPESLCVPASSLITGWDFSTTAVKCVAFDMEGNTVATVRVDTDQWYGTPDEVRKKAEVAELNLAQLEGQARASTRLMASRLKTLGRLNDWVAGGISATHHTAGRIDADHTQVRRAICWNDHSLGDYHAIGLARLGGPDRVRQLIGGPWAIRYSLSHLVKDEECLEEAAWRRTYLILPHGALAAGYLTGNFDVLSVSSAASTGLMNLESCTWCRDMLDALANPEYRELAWHQLPRIADQYEPVGRLSEHLALEADIDPAHRPLIFPTSDDQQAGLVGGGAVDAGQMAVVLGTSAVVNSSFGRPASGNLDVMRLNWGPYLWMRCYNNGAGFADLIAGKKPDYEKLEKKASQVPAGCHGATVLPFVAPEPSLGITTDWLKNAGITAQRLRWSPSKPSDSGCRYRAAMESLAYLIALGVRAHEQAGQRIERITVSGGLARSDLMCNILATVLDRQLLRLRSDEGPALGAAVTALAAYETQLRQQQGIAQPFLVSDAVPVLVKFREQPVDPNPEWRDVYRQGLEAFEKGLP
jgi:sugar (pentulose or hexulose) kinase